MFVRLLSRTGAPATIGYDRGGSHPEGRYLATVVVPAGGIGGVRAGLRGRACGPSGCRPAPALFPLENNPFVSAGGALCDMASLARALRGFMRAYDTGDLRALGRLFAAEPRFVWYSSGAPGRRLGAEAGDRPSLVRYFQRRRAAGDRIELSSFRFGYDPKRQLGHFSLRGNRRAGDFRGGRWFGFEGKGALDCSRPPVTIAVMSI